ncbi:Asparagine--tRNA ligase [Buchnera aphidicola (Tetraneura ulmi)]|uniref:asparagine--tRNA ligase n=1 Tax=Buchnera aphidicola TaxID=9 RepID=UPI003463E59B
MSIVSVIEIQNDKVKIGELITINGWIRSRRDSKLGFSFIDVNDGSSCNPIQCIAYNNLKNYYKDVLKLTVGCSITILGNLFLSSGKKQKYEIVINNINILGFVDNPERYPISSKNHTVEHLRNVVHLRSRTNFIGSISRIRDFISYALKSFLYKKKYVWVPTPIITSIDSEGLGKMFRVSTLDFYNLPKDNDGKIDFRKDFFGKESFLTVSGQLTLETYACSLSKVYTFGPTFRAENSNTSRHLSEFWMLELEESFLSLDEIIQFSENMLKKLINLVLKNCYQDIKFLELKSKNKIFCKLNFFLENDFIKKDYAEIIDILNFSKKFKEKINFGTDLSSEHEKYILNYYSNIPIVIKNHPKKIKAFYMKLNDDKKTVSSFDLLLPGVGEVIGGSEREDKFDKLETRLKEMGMSLQDYSWYLDLRKYGTVPHSGFGMGFERLLSYITNVTNVRDLIPFPRTAKNSLF